MTVGGRGQRRVRVVDAHTANGIASLAAEARFAAPGVFRGRAAEQRRIQSEFVGEKAGQQEPFAYKVMSASPESLGLIGIPQQLDDPVRALVDRVDKEATCPVA